MNNEHHQDSSPEIEREPAPFALTPEDRALLTEIFETNKKHLDRHYHTGFGIFHSANKNSNYFNQVWARDSAHAAANYFVHTNPKAVIETLRTFFKHQRADGAFPSRVERDYQLIKFIPILRAWSRQIFDLIEVKLRGNTERAVYEGMDFSGGEDTVPAILIEAGELFLTSAEGREFVLRHFWQLETAAKFFKKRIDPDDGLAIMKKTDPDWADTLKRRGKLATVNIWWARGLFLLGEIAIARGETEVAEAHQREFEKLKKSILTKIYDGERHYFKAAVDDKRLDTVASIFGALYFLDAGEAAKLEYELNVRVLRSSGLRNFDPPYSNKDVHWMPRLMRQWPYHNKFVWPWVTCQNIRVKIHIAEGHPNAMIRAEYRRESLEDLLLNAKLFKGAQGALEIFEPDAPKIGRTAFYRPPRNFMASMAAYQGAYLRLKELGWIEK